jgi:hypothetical protein
VLGGGYHDESDIHDSLAVIVNRNRRRAVVYAVAGPSGRRDGHVRFCVVG